MQRAENENTALGITEETPESFATLSDSEREKLREQLLRRETPITEKKVLAARKQLGFDLQPKQEPTEADLEECWVRLKSHLEHSREFCPVEHRRELLVRIVGLISGWPEAKEKPLVAGAVKPTKLVGTSMESETCQSARSTPADHSRISECVPTPSHGNRKESKLEPAASDSVPGGQGYGIPQNTVANTLRDQLARISDELASIKDDLWRTQHRQFLLRFHQVHYARRGRLLILEMEDHTRNIP